jgi:hypothetical protein
MAQHDDRAAQRLYIEGKKRENLKASRLTQSIRELAASRHGREFLWHLLALGKFGSQPFSGNALTTAFGCGELNVGQAIFTDIINVDPAIFVQMQKEQLDDNDANTRADNNIASGNSVSSDGTDNDGN